MGRVREVASAAPKTVTKVSTGEVKKKRRAPRKKAGFGPVETKQVDERVMALAWEIVETSGYSKVQIESLTSVIVR